MAQVGDDGRNMRPTSSSYVNTCTYIHNSPYRSPTNVYIYIYIFAFQSLSRTTRFCATRRVQVRTFTSFSSAILSGCLAAAHNTVRRVSRRRRSCFSHGRAFSLRKTKSLSRARTSSARHSLAHSSRVARLHSLCHRVRNIDRVLFRPQRRHSTFPSSFVPLQSLASPPRSFFSFFLSILFHIFFLFVRFTLSLSLSLSPFVRCILSPPFSVYILLPLFLSFHPFFLPFPEYPAFSAPTTTLGGEPSPCDVPHVVSTSKKAIC